MSESSRPPPSLDDSATADQAIHRLAELFSRPETIRRDHGRDWRWWMPVTLEDGTVGFVAAPGTLAVEDAFAEIFGPEPEDGNVEI